MGARKVPVATKLSDEELDALLTAADRTGTTKSKYIADAIAERLRREHFLEAADVGESEPCQHRITTKFQWGARCDGCGKVVSGRHAAG